MNLDLDETIPQELYIVVAELLVWVSELDRAASGAQKLERPDSKPRA